MWQNVAYFQREPLYKRHPILLDFSRLFSYWQPFCNGYGCYSQPLSTYCTNIRKIRGLKKGYGHDSGVYLCMCVCAYFFIFLWMNPWIFCKTLLIKHHNNYTHSFSSTELSSPIICFSHFSIYMSHWWWRYQCATFVFFKHVHNVYIYMFVCHTLQPQLKHV